MSDKDDNNTWITSDTFLFGFMMVILAIFIISADFNPWPNQKAYAEDPNQKITPSSIDDTVLTIGFYYLPIGTYTVVSTIEGDFDSSNHKICKYMTRVRGESQGNLIDVYNICRPENQLKPGTIIKVTEKPRTMTIIVP